MSTASERLNELPELSPPPELAAEVLDLALVALKEAAEDAERDRAPAVSGFEIFVHGTITAAYLVYAASSALGLLDRMLAF